MLETSTHSYTERGKYLPNGAGHLVEFEQTTRGLRVGRSTTQPPHPQRMWMVSPRFELEAPKFLAEQTAPTS